MATENVLTALSQTAIRHLRASTGSGLHAQILSMALREETLVSWAQFERWVQKNHPAYQGIAERLLLWIEEHIPFVNCDGKIDHEAIRDVFHHAGLTQLGSGYRGKEDRRKLTDRSRIIRNWHFIQYLLGTKDSLRIHIEEEIARRVLMQEDRVVIAALLHEATPEGETRFKRKNLRARLIKRGINPDQIARSLTDQVRLDLDRLKAEEARESPRAIIAPIAERSIESVEKKEEKPLPEKTSPAATQADIRHHEETARPRVQLETARFVVGWKAMKRILEILVAEHDWPPTCPDLFPSGLVKPLVGAMNAREFTKSPSTLPSKLRHAGALEKLGLVRQWVFVWRICDVDPVLGTGVKFNEALCLNDTQLRQVIAYAFPTPADMAQAKKDVLAAIKTPPNDSIPSPAIEASAPRVAEEKGIKVKVEAAGEAHPVTAEVIYRILPPRLARMRSIVNEKREAALAEIEALEKALANRRVDVADFDKRLVAIDGFTAILDTLVEKEE